MNPSNVAATAGAAFVMGDSEDANVNGRFTSSSCTNNDKVVSSGEDTCKVQKPPAISTPSTTTEETVSNSKTEEADPSPGKVTGKDFKRPPPIDTGDSPENSGSGSMFTENPPNPKTSPSFTSPPPPSQAKPTTNARSNNAFEGFEFSAFANATHSEPKHKARGTGTGRGGNVVNDGNPVPENLDVLHNMSVEEILNLFRDQIQKDTTSYCQEAEMLVTDDLMLRKSEKYLREMVSDTHKIIARQELLVESIHTISGWQTMLDSNLVKLEDQVDQLFEGSADVAPNEADLFRQQVFDKANEIELIMKDLSKNTSRLMDDMSHDVTDYVCSTYGRLMVAAQSNDEALAKLQVQAQQLSNDVAVLEEALPRSGNS